MNKKLILITAIFTGIILVGCDNGKSINNNSEATKNNTSVNDTISGNNTNNQVNSSNVSETNSSNNTAVNTASSSVNNNATGNSSNGSSIVKSQEEIYLGQWVIKKTVGYCKVGTYSQDDIKSLIGKKLTFTRGQSTCFGDNKSDINNEIQKPFYQKSTVPADQFLSKWKVQISTALGINATSVTEINVTDTSNIAACIFYVKDSNTLILYGGGTFFELDRIG